MVSRVERTPFAAWWWTVDRLMLAALIVLMLGGIVLSLAASPPVAARLGLEPFYFVNRHILYLIPALIAAAGDLAPVGAQHPAGGAGGLHREPAADRGDANVRRRGQGRAALDRHSRRQYPAVGIPQAGLRHPDRLAVRRIGATAGNAGQYRRAGAAAGRRQRARAAARLRADHADHAGLGYACSSWPACGWSGCSAWAAPPRSGSPAPMPRCRMSRAASSASWIRPPATPSTSTRRSNRSCAAAGSGAGRAREPSSASSPRAHTDFVFAVAAEEFGIVLCLVLLALVCLHRAARVAPSPR